MKPMRHLLFGLLCATIGFGCTKDRSKSAISSFDPDSEIASRIIHNSVYHPRQAWLGSTEGHRRLVILEEYDHMNDSEGGGYKRNLVLTCWMLHEDGRIDRELFKIERDAKVMVDWNIRVDDRNTEKLVITKWDNNDGSGTSVENLDLLTGKAVEKSKDR